MIVNSKWWGPIEVPADAVIDFPQGILGFPSVKRYALLDIKHGLKLLQAVEVQEPSFVVMNPSQWFKDYNPVIEGRELSMIQLDSGETFQIYVIITVPPNPVESTANLRGPLIINLSKRLGKQVVLLDGQYSTRVYLFPDLVQRATQGLSYVAG